MQDQSDGSDETGFPLPSTTAQGRQLTVEQAKKVRKVRKVGRV
jgi:hypothetical protein